jgi:hypothetical protein
MKIDLSNTRIRISTQAEKIAALIVASQLTKKKISDTWWEDALRSPESARAYPYVCFKDAVISCNLCSDGNEIVDFKDLARLFTEHQEVVPLEAGGYEAIVKKSGVTVGCTTFPLSVIDKLVEAKNKVS